MLASAIAGLMPALISVVTPAAAPEPRNLEVPPPLRARARKMDTSGIAWAEPLGRYLVVIDDTLYEKPGKGRGRGAPALLALSREGRFDEAPVPILGVTELDDAESICAAGSDLFYLLTSHTQDNEGRLRWPRRQLLELKLEGRALRARRLADLTDGKGSVPQLLDASGIAHPAGLDLEAVACHEGAVYVGMKAPLGPGGEALILKIADPAEAFRRDHVRKGHLTVWARLALAAPAVAADDGGRQAANVHQGVTDLAFARDGALYIAANAPKGAPPDGGGAVWRWAYPGPVAAAPPARPELVARFPGLKPEGLTFTPDGASLIVLFDRDGAPPQWTHLPLPRKAP